MLYAIGAKIRYWFTTPTKVSIPVICVGNIVAGGAGKTPTTIALARILRDRVRSPHILSRGYGAPIDSPIRVNPDQHTPQQVGDEPLLLARAAPTWACPNRLASAHAAISAKADVLILDDGFQNPSLTKDISFLVIDGTQGLGNGWTIPAGPLREPLEWALKRCDAVILVGEDRRKVTQEITCPLIRASIKCTNSQPKRVYAFTGLGYPDKFYQTLKDQGYEIVGTHSFPDHHNYQHHEVERLIEIARNCDARLITTEKDIIKIPDYLQNQMDVLKIELVFESEEQIIKILESHNL